MLHSRTKNNIRKKVHKKSILGTIYRFCTGMERSPPAVGNTGKTMLHFKLNDGLLGVEQSLKMSAITDHIFLYTMIHTETFLYDFQK